MCPAGTSGKWREARSGGQPSVWPSRRRPGAEVGDRRSGVAERRQQEEPPAGEAAAGEHAESGRSTVAVKKGPRAWGAGTAGLSPAGR
ncbi:hypothetical protein NDU88_000988 [Pleurodeles waltl]|uniref:Uncharacterized protein n=1 Tax=Pleurodeles waltl TaxID=8319 RepID=A0AAV7WH35_PLEWA|nr:hypothetical protein NDU88_000988 [Pleurodeles waltl]